VASDDGSLFRRYTGLWQRHIDSMLNPIVNPVYRAGGGPGGWHLEKQGAGAEGSKTAPGNNQYVPDKASVASPSLDPESILALKTSDRQAFGDLARHFVVVDAPEGFQ
jgi:hypothetical protein